MLELLNTDVGIGTLLLYREFVPKSIRRIFPSDDLLSALKAGDMEERAVIVQRAKERLTELLVLGSQVSANHVGGDERGRFADRPVHMGFGRQVNEWHDA